MNIQTIFKQPKVKAQLLKAQFGIEKESQRVTLNGDLVSSSHPKKVGSRQYHPYIQTDFAETQIELVTDVFEDYTELLDKLSAIHEVALRSMPKEEMLWPLSMPPALPEDEKEILIAQLENEADVKYRRYLAETYGRRKQMVSGIHFNFEFGSTLLQAMFDAQTEYQELAEFKSAVYLKVTRNYLHYRWLYIYFYGASPLSEANYFFNEQAPQEPMRSIRNSRFGYTNREDVHVSYESLERYLADLQKMVAQGKLSEEKEFYAAVRLRGGHRVADLVDAGIRYIELRNIDLNPFSAYGITKEQVEFLHLFMLYLLWKEEGENHDAWVKIGQEKNEQVCSEHPFKPSRYQEEIQKFVAEFAVFLEEAQLVDDHSLIESLQQKAKDPKKTLAGQWLQLIEKESQAAMATKIGNEYYQQAWEKPYQLAGYQEMELSTQILMFDAIQKGIEVEVLDRQDQFLKLTVDRHIEYVKNGNMTSKDTYISPLLMANKTVTKKVLSQAGFRVPQGEEFSSIEQAKRAYSRFKEQAIVIKPKSTNYGLGISIFKEEMTKEDYEEALEIAFKEDQSILIEEFLVGTEYRFFVINQQVRAIMLRVPANVVGDGKRTIEELVHQKNQDPLRGTNHRSPLEWIQLGEIEQLMLKTQGYTIQSVLEKDKVVYLRENSNVSTGGDSLDVTDEFSADYKEIAVAAVNALGATICGIDLIIPDKQRSAREKGAYGIIEGNFNPAMMMHAYPYRGKGRRLTQDVLALLFPEMY